MRPVQRFGSSCGNCGSEHEGGGEECGERGGEVAYGIWNMETNMRRSGKHRFRRIDLNSNNHVLLGILHIQLYVFPRHKALVLRDLDLNI